MKNLFSSLSTWLVAAACALSLGSCNRAEYAMLPKGSSYLGSTRIATPVPATPAADANAPAAPTDMAAVPTTAPVAATLAPVAPALVAVAPATAPVMAASAAAPATLGNAAAITTAKEPAKMTRVQRFAASKTIKLLSKASGVTQVKQKLDVAKAQKVSGNLRTGIVLILIGLIISLFSRVNSIFGLIGAIIAIIGLIFIVLWLLDNI